VPGRCVGPVGVDTGAVRTMTTDETRSFLEAGTRTAKVATMRRDGRPHVVPVWFVLDGDDVVFTTGERSLKGKALQRDPRVSLCVDDERPLYSYVTINGLASLGTELDELRRLATRIGGRYMGAERAEEFGRRNAVAGELLVRVKPVDVIAHADVAS
jgi:PPOX class probable F420-dependent enzyme